MDTTPASNLLEGATEVGDENCCCNNRDLKKHDAFNRTRRSVISVNNKLVTWQHLSIERTGHHVVLTAWSCLRSLMTVTQRVQSGGSERKEQALFVNVQL